MVQQYQDVSFQQETRFDGDANAGLAVALDVAVKQEECRSKWLTFHKFIDESVLQIKKCSRKQKARSMIYKDTRFRTKVMALFVFGQI